MYVKINQNDYKGRCQMNVFLGKINKSTHTKEKKIFQTRQYFGEFYWSDTQGH